MTIQPAVRFDLAKVEAILQPFDQSSLPGVAVGIAHLGVPLYRAGVGLADMDAPLTLSPAIRLRVGSVTKQFTCLAYLLLCESGFAGVDDLLGTHLPELHPAARQVTLRQLMAHTSGVRDAYNVFSRFNDPREHFAGASQRVGSAELLRYYETISDAETAPGTAWCYSNGGYLLLSAAIERIAGQELETVLAERVFAPIGMHDTILLRADTRFVGNRGSQHVCAVGGGFERMYFGLDNFAGGGAAISTIDDLLRWLAHIDRPAVGSEALWREMRTAQTLANGRPTAYGLGLELGRYRGADTIAHAGGAFGGGAHLLKFPAAGLDIAVLSNRQDVHAPAIAQQIADACLVGLTPVREIADDAPRIEGNFQSATTGCVIQLYEANARQIVSVDGLDLPYVRDRAGMLRQAGDIEGNGWTILPLDERTTPGAIRLDRWGAIEELTRVEAVPVVAPFAIAGTYRAADIDTEASIAAKGGRLFLESRGRYGQVDYRLEPLSPHIYRAQGSATYRGIGISAGILTFDHDGRGFRFSSGTTTGLHFERTA